MSLEVLYKEMAELTKPKCLGCNNGWKHNCCDTMYCQIAKEFAKDQGVELEFTNNEIPFLDDDNNCIVPPHLRPLCTLHNCAINSVGCTDDKIWDEQYFKLKDKINNEENKTGRHAYVYH